MKAKKEKAVNSNLFLMKRNNLKIRSLEDFIKLLEDDSAPEVNPYLLALWHDKKGNWHKAHEIAQNIVDPGGSRIHAYLHRREGDLGNANYWYSRAGEIMPRSSLDEEWNELSRYFILNGK